MNRHDIGLQHFPKTELKHPSHAVIGITPLPDKLYVVTMLSNPLRWRSRYRNYWSFQRHVQDAGAELYTVEVAYGDRPFEITQADDPRDIQLRTADELWHKENAINLAIQRLPADAKYVAWIDADVTFQRPDWAQETMHLLQHYDFIQMFSHAHDINSSHAVVTTHTGFMFQYLNSLVTPGVSMARPPDDYGSGGYSGAGPGPQGYWHPGFAWAARREALNKVGMLIDFAILGSADWHMARALIGTASGTLQRGLHRNYVDSVMEWERRAELHIRRNVGYMDGSVYHSYHGKKEHRHYNTRWKFLTQSKFNPSSDIKKDWQGLWQLKEDNPMLRDGLRVYNRMRHEDS